MRLLALAVVLAVEQVVRADWHLLVVLLLGLVGRVDGGVDRLVIALLVVHQLIIYAVRRGRLLMGSYFIDVLIIGVCGVAGVLILPRRRTVLRPPIVWNDVLARVDRDVRLALVGRWMRSRQD